MFIPGQVCDGCDMEIGRESYVVLQDGISRHLHKFHARCAPNDKDVQRHFGLVAEPLAINTKGLSFGRV